MSKNIKSGFVDSIRFIASFIFPAVPVILNSGTKYSARHFLDAIVFDNKIWVIGGYKSSSSFSNDIWMSNILN